MQPSKNKSLLEESQLKALDLTSFNGGVNPYPKGDKSLERTFSWPIERYRRTISEVVGATGGRVLDLLCGAGRWSVFLAEQNTEVLGIDHLPGCTRIADGLCKHFGFSNAEFEAGDVSYISKLPSESFDTVWIYSALQYVERENTLNECYRLLKPGGKLFVGNYNSYGLMLEHVIKGVEGRKINEGSSQWALDALQRGEQADGLPSFISPEGASAMCARFGFRLVMAKSDQEFYPGSSPPVQVAETAVDDASCRRFLLRAYASTVSLVAVKDPQSRSSIASGLSTRSAIDQLRQSARKSPLARRIWRTFKG